MKKRKRERGRGKEKTKREEEDKEEARKCNVTAEEGREGEGGRRVAEREGKRKEDNNTH